MELGFDVVELDEPDLPAVGEQAPEFVRPLVGAEYWEDVALSELDTPVCLLFHPMDGSFPATYIWNELRERGFDEYDGSVVGVSISTPYAHKRFLEETDLVGRGFRLFSDPTNELAEQYGVAHDLDGMAGVSEPRPATLVLEDSRTVRYAWGAEEHPEFPPYDELEAALSDLA